MKKTGIFNHWNVNNYGALFLAYALEAKMLELGYDVETIDYLPDEVARPWKVSMVSKIGPVQYLLRLGYFSVFVLPRYRSFRNFRKRLHISAKRYTDATFPEAAGDYDKLIAGGDQLWNCKINYFNENNFLPFMKEKERKLVYAASLAQDQMRKGFEDRFRELADGFGYITTREETGTRIIEQLTDRSAPRVADPAFLLTAEEWGQLAQPPRLRKPYVFVYQVQSDVSVVEHAQRLAKEKGLEIVYCPFPLRKQIRCRRYPYMSPERWLGYMMQAEYVVTDAYHGLVFAIIFHKQFSVEISDYGKDTHSRITDLLKRLELTDRLLQPGRPLDIDRDIAYDAVDRFLEEDRRQSIDHIHKMMAL